MECFVAHCIPAVTTSAPSVSAFLKEANSNMAWIQCRCKAVKVTFSVSKPSHSLECCCVDCYQKYTWSCEAGGVDIPPSVLFEQKKKALSLAYFPSRMVVEGKDKLKFNKLRENGQSTNCVASCCNTLLFIDYPSYRDAVVMLSPDFCPVYDCRFEPPLYRCWIKDWPAEDVAKLEPRIPGFFLKKGPDGQTVTDGVGDYDGPRGEVRRRVAALVENTKSGMSEGETFSDLLAAAGGEIAVLGLPELERSFKGGE
eukprot:m.296100 g.296100  ORF g.296100 m.296100 type:complete len:255 (+) comp27188_c0_seq5:2340-3104(+)